MFFFLLCLRMQRNLREEKNTPSAFRSRIQRTRNSRGTTSIYRRLTTSAFQSVQQHPSSVTGTPVAAYWKKSFGALLTGCIQHKPFVASHQPTTLCRRNFLPTLSCSNAFDIGIIAPLPRNVKHFFAFRYPKNILLACGQNLSKKIDKCKKREYNIR